MKNATDTWTEIVCILDRSGSMSDIADDTIGGFNQFITSQQEEPGRARVTLVLFDDRVETPWKQFDLDNAPKLDEQTYFVRGSTALLDAVGRTLEGTRSRIEAMHPDERPEDVIVLVMTDGYENASQEYNWRTVTAMIEQRQGEGWEFVFIGAEIDAMAVAQRLGMADGSASGSVKSAVGTMESFQRMDRAVRNVRRKLGKGDVSAPLDD